MTRHGLTDRELQLLLKAFSPFADQIQSVGLVGSRATGIARPNSDVDLVLYGDVGQAIVDRLWTIFDESALARTVDVVAYDLITYPPLKAHIDAVMVPLFSQADLKAAKAGRESVAGRVV